MPTSVRINERYEKREILGQGGMGVVWWAYDHTLKRDVSLKTIRDVRDKTALDLFRKECATLASMAHPNIVEIYDIGAMEENGQEVPYFVMPLLRGATLDKLIETASSRLTVERCVDILLQTCRGLQAAHDLGLVHRDLKPSNIFVLQDDSVKIIDFGVAHLIDVHSTVKHGGTLLYMAPEQLMLKKPTPASDLFSLGVVAFEAITRRRPFEATSREDVAQRILSEIPPPAFQVNSGVSLPISQVIHKAMAKQPYQRFASAKEFGESLQKALHNEPIECFSPSRIEPRIQRVRKALEQGELEFANEIISELESEALLHPELGSLRKSTNDAIRSRDIQQLLETARRRFEEEEYQMALQKVQEILNLDSSNMEAHSLRGDIENKRSSRQIDDWLRLARQHLENHAYGHAREALQNVLQMRPKETKAQQLLSDVDRREQEYQKIRQEKDNVYNAALDALDKGDLTSALTKLERVLEMDRRAPDTFSPDRAAIYQKLYNKVRSEHDQLANSYQEARKQLDNGNLAAAFASCEAVLQRSPSNALFQSLKLDVEDRQRQEFSAFVARVDRSVDAEADLDRKIRLLEEALEKYPGESHFQRTLHTVRSKRDLVDSIVSKARSSEDKGQYGEALAQWEILRNIYRQYPGLDVETERVSRRKQLKDRTDVKGQWVQQIDQALHVGDFSRALDLCGRALAENAGDAELLTLERAVKQGIERLEQAQGLLSEAEAALSAQDSARGLELLREANRMDANSATIRQRLLDVLLAEAKARIDSDWREADEYLHQALDLDPGNALAKSLKTLVQDKKQDFHRSEALSKARALQAGGDLIHAISTLDEALALYPDDNRLSQFRSTLNRNRQDAERALGRRRDLDDVRKIQKEAETVFNKDDLESLFAKTQALATRYGDEKEFTAAAQELRRRVERSQQPPPDWVPGDQQPQPPPKPDPPIPPIPPVPARFTPALRWLQAQIQAHRPRIQNAISQVVVSLRSLPQDIVRVRQGKLAWTSLTVPAFVIAGGLLLLSGIVQVIVPPKPATPANVPVAETGPPPAAVPPDAGVVAGTMAKVVVDMEGAQVSIAGEQLKDNGSGVFVSDKISEGDWTLEILAPDGVKATIGIRIKDDAMPEVLEPLKAERARAFAAVAFRGAASFYGFSPGEKVKVGLEQGSTEEVGPGGLLREGLGTGPKVVLVEYGADRRPHQLELGSNPTLFLALTPVNFGNVQIVIAGSPDVKLFVGGRERPYRRWLGLSPGKHLIRVERVGFRPEEKTVDVKRGDYQSLEFNLKEEPKMARLVISNGRPGDQVLVNNQPHRSGTDVPPGRWNVQVTRQDFKPISQVYDFLAGKDTVIDVGTLKFDPIRFDVTFQVTGPASANITVNGSPSGLRTQLPEGRHTVEATEQGYDNYRNTFEVKAGETNIISFEMKKKPVAAAPVAAPKTAPSAMSGWRNSLEWNRRSDGYYVKNNDKQSLYQTAAGNFSFTTPCKAKKVFGVDVGDCKVVVFLRGSEQGELRFEITDAKVKRKGKQVTERSFAKITGEMQIRVRATKERTVLEVNGKEVDSVEGDHTNGRFGIDSVKEMKDFKYSPN